MVYHSSHQLQHHNHYNKNTFSCSPLIDECLLIDSVSLGIVCNIVTGIKLVSQCECECVCVFFECVCVVVVVHLFVC